MSARIEVNGIDLPLLAATPSRWFEAASGCWQTILIDHANCEKKAASTALSLIYAYAEDHALTARLSRLAREELRHFEQVQTLMFELGVPFTRLSPSRYAEGLRRSMCKDEPDRKLDLLLCGALIEARSYERFVGLAPLLPARVSAFYESLAQSEARHLGLYLRLAEERFAPQWRARLELLARVEADLATTNDPQLRFHSGLPIALDGERGARHAREAQDLASCSSSNPRSSHRSTLP